MIYDYFRRSRNRNRNSNPIPHQKSSSWKNSNESHDSGSDPPVTSQHAVLPSLHDPQSTTHDDHRIAVLATREPSITVPGPAFSCTFPCIPSSWPPSRTTPGFRSPISWVPQVQHLADQEVARPREMQNALVCARSLPNARTRSVAVPRLVVPAACLEDDDDERLAKERQPNKR